VSLAFVASPVIAMNGIGEALLASLALVDGTPTVTFRST
jgi:hypothetical protein